jgi:hypothetical protein
MLYTTKLELNHTQLPRIGVVVHATRHLPLRSWVSGVYDGVDSVHECRPNRGCWFAGGMTSCMLVEIAPNVERYAQSGVVIGHRLIRQVENVL